VRGIRVVRNDSCLDARSVPRVARRESRQRAAGTGLTHQLRPGAGKPLEDSLHPSLLPETG